MSLTTQPPPQKVVALYFRMEELVRSLRNLDLAPPTGEQIVALIDADPRVEKQLAQQLAVPSRIELEEEDDGAAMMDAALLSGATEAMLQNYNATLKREIEFQKQELERMSKPVPLKKIPKKALLAAQAAAIRRREEERAAGLTKDGLYVPRQIMDSDHTYFSEADLANLTLVDADELRVPFRHEGRYLLVQVASRLCLYASCSFVGITPAGVALPISIAHFTPWLTLPPEELDALLPVGSIVLIREPYVSLHYMGLGGPITGGKGTVGVRVDTPSDVQVLDAQSPWCVDVTWADWQAPGPSSGVVWMQEGPLTRALQESRTCPLVSREQTRAHIDELRRQERPGAAWREVCAAELCGVWAPHDEVDAHGADVLLRCEVLLDLQMYNAVLARTDDVLCLPLSATLSSSLSECRARARSALETASHGPSDDILHSMFMKTLEDPTPRMEYAEYTGPVAVQAIPGAGRGLVLTRDVDEGELLLFCRATAATYSRDRATDGVPLLRCNAEAGVTSTTTQVVAATRCLHKLLDAPDWAPAFLGLTAGPATPPSPYVADTYPMHTAPPLDAADAVRAVRPNVSAHYVNNVLRFNAFGPAAVPAASAGLDPMSRSTMPHPLPAILNHACLPNVSSVFFGDFVATRALHPLPQGTQIMHQYVQGELAYDARQAQLSKHGFVCGCALCELDRADGEDALHRRAALLARDWPPLQERSRALFHGGPTVGDTGEAHADMVSALSALSAELEATYAPTRPGLRPALVDVWYRAALHAREADVAAAVPLAERSVAATGALLRRGDGARRLDALPDLHFDAAIRGMLLLAELYWAQSRRDEAFAWLASAAQTHHCMIGGGHALFLQRWGDEADTHASLAAWAAQHR